MEEYADIYYVDDARNALRDHRTYGDRSRAPVWRARPTAAQPVQAGGYRPAPAAAVPVYQDAVYPQPVIGHPGFAAPVYQQAPLPWYGQSAGSVLGRMTLGQVAELAAQAVAALMSLPPAPAPVSEADPNLNIANLVTYQTALAAHAKRDEQLRTLGSLVARLVA